MDRRFGNFVWDEEKERDNLRKHSLDFETAVRVFKDPKRKIYVDERHSVNEERMFCFGRVEGRIVTVRFTYREGLIRVYGAGYWRKGRGYYEAKDS